MLLQPGCKWEIGSPVTSTEFSGEKVEREGMVWAVSILSARLKFSQAHVALLSPRPQLEYCGPRASTGASRSRSLAVLWQQRRLLLGCVISTKLYWKSLLGGPVWSPLPLAQPQFCKNLSPVLNSFLLKIARIILIQSPWNPFLAALLWLWSFYSLSNILSWLPILLPPTLAILY